MTNQRFDWRFAHAWEVYQRLPMKQVSVLPDEGFGMRVVNIARTGNPNRPNTPILMWVHCLPKPPKNKRWGHRLLVVCSCGKNVPIGRMVSHATACVPFQTNYPHN